MSLEEQCSRIFESLVETNTTKDLHNQTTTDTETQNESFYNNINIKIDLINNEGKYNDGNYIFTTSGNKLHRIDEDEDIVCDISDFNDKTRSIYNRKIKPIKRKSRFSSLSFPSLSFPSFPSFSSRRRGGKRKYTKRRTPTKKRRRHTKRRRPTKRRRQTKRRR